jgi:8-oxo-dGTP diphosphatase
VPAPKPKTPKKSEIEAKPREGEDEAFLAGYEPSQFDRPSVAVDVVLLTADEDALFTLLIRRGEPPQRGRWSLPGTFVRLEESLEQTASRVLESKAGVGRVFLEQLYTFGAPRRDPRTRVIAVAYYALVAPEELARAKVLDEAEPAARARIEVPWEGETGGPVSLFSEDGRELELAFDHADMIGMAVKRLRGKLDYTPIGFQLLPDRFTLLELQRVHETVLGRPLNKDSFRRRMLASGLLEATGDVQQAAAHRPAELYRFARRSAT